MDNATELDDDAVFDVALLHYEVEADVLALPADVAVVETGLASADEAALEEGIASVFDALRTSDADYVAGGNIEAEAVTFGASGIDPTFELLAELNRLWAQPLAA